MSIGNIAPMRVRIRKAIYVPDPTLLAFEYIFCPRATDAPITAPKLKTDQQMDM